MKLTKVHIGGSTSLARVVDGQFEILPFVDLADLLMEPKWQDLESKMALAYDESKIVNLFGSTTRIFCIGLNYKSHIHETNKPTPEYPTVFAKFASTLIGPNDNISIPRISETVDWEVELGVVIGKAAKDVTKAEALEYVAGYVVTNDISMREWQNRTTQWFQGKNFEASTPVGPILVTPDEIDHARDLHITCAIDGESVQDSRTSDLLFQPADLISYISAFTTLLPGDLILTGTPGGVGNARTPKRFLKQGEVLTSTIEGIGTLKNKIVSQS
ncbi:MAG TPA: fumarylacetoacetate hydrolase family protein [Candidatus Nanopelagicaceae bacterium]|nr:fumarylacetoacetate hydrolase family protein [Candidatus Nanopelagicaceae bacterium]